MSINVAQETNFGVDDLAGSLVLHTPLATLVVTIYYVVCMFVCVFLLAHIYVTV